MEYEESPVAEPSSVVSFIWVLFIETKKQCSCFVSEIELHKCFENKGAGIFKQKYSQINLP